MKRIYLASPLGFAASTSHFMEEAVRRLAEVVIVENPWDDVRFAQEFADIATRDSYAERVARLQVINMELGKTNTERIDRCDAVFAVLDGVDVDSGTAAEIGYAFARGKRIVGLRTDFRLAGDNIGATVNLQVEYFISAGGGRVATTIADFLVAAEEL